MRPVTLLQTSKGYMLLFVVAMLLLWLLFGCAEDFTGKRKNHKPEIKIESWDTGTIRIGIVLKTERENTLQVKIKDKLSDPVTLRY